MCESDTPASLQRIAELAQLRLFFIVGVAKSGTTWLQMMLDGHPAISCFGEGHFTDNLLPLLERAAREYGAIIHERNRRMYGESRGFPVLESDDVRELFRCAVLLLLDKQRGSKSVECIGEKTPGHIRELPLLAEVFPRAKFLHIVRDGRDVAVSGWLHNARVDEARLRRMHGDFAQYALHVASIWQRQIERARSFGQAHPQRYFEIRYEDLHRDPDGCMARILCFLGVDASSSACRACRDSGEFEKLARGRRRGQEDRGSHFRKGVVGDWREHFSDELHAGFLARAAEYLRHFDYITDAERAGAAVSAGAGATRAGEQRKMPDEPAPAIVPAAAPLCDPSDSDDGQFARAVAWHQAGRLGEAEAVYRAILARHPRHAEALHLCGVIAHQAGRHAEAAALIEQAIAWQGERATYHSNLGIALRALGRLPDAASALRRAVALAADYAAGHKNLAIVLKELGEIGAAAEHFRRAVELNPRDAGAANSLGALLQSEGKFEQAAQAFRAALEARPNDADALNNLGVTLKDLGRFEESLECLRRSVAARPNSALGLNNLAVTLRELGQHDESLATLEQAVRLDPSSTVIRSNLGVALKNAGRLDAAAAELRRCLALDPNSVAAHNNLGETLKELGQLQDSLTHLRRAIEIDPRCAEAHNNLGITLKELGEQESAAEHFRKSLALAPRYVPALTNLGNSLIASGELDLGTQLFERAVEFDPHCVAAYYALAVHSRHRFSDDEIDRMHALLERRALSASDRGLLHFALATVLDKVGRHERAFEHARQANELRKRTNVRGGTSFQPEQHARFVDSIIACFPRQRFVAGRDLGVSSPLPVLIVGMPRSSTTLVEQILASHPLIHGAGELPDIEQMVATLPQRLGSRERYPFCTAQLSAHTARPLAESYLQRLESLGRGAARVVDKMTVNFLHLGLIALLFPNARVIHCKRDPRDTCLSCYLHNFASPGLNFTFDLDHLADFYLQYERLMRHWAEVLPLPILDVEYETLVREQESMSRRLIEFCGLDWDAACLAFHENKRAVRTASFLQVREPIYARSIGRWKKYEAQLRPLLSRLESRAATPPA